MIITKHIAKHLTAEKKRITYCMAYYSVLQFSIIGGKAAKIFPNKQI